MALLLTVDIGNTNTVIGEFEGDTLVRECRLKSDVTRTRDEYEVFLRQLLPVSKGVEAVVVSSVVPTLTPVLCGLLRSLFSVQPLIIGPGVKTGLAVKVKNPRGVGADRVVNAVAARKFYGTPAIVVDFGTATSFDVVDDSDAYLGGAIAPGVEVALSGLVSKTAQLPKIALEMPEAAIGTDTVEAMCSGTVLGYLCLVEGLIDRIQAELGKATVIATGGLGALFCDESNRIQHYDKHLTLKGLREVARLNGLG